jgi:Dna[CI] antecedent, DciA
VAARTQPVSFNEGTLVVEVTDTAWRNQLQSLADRYVTGYEAVLGPLVRKVQFKIQQSAVSQHSAGSKQSAISSQHSAKPVRSSSTKNPTATDGSTATSKERFQKEGMRKG